MGVIDAFLYLDSAIYGVQHCKPLPEGTSNNNDGLEHFRTIYDLREGGGDEIDTLYYSPKLVNAYMQFSSRKILKQSVKVRSNDASAFFWINTKNY